MPQVRYVLTFKNKEGLRVLAHDNNGRNTWLTKEQGEEWLKAMKENNSFDSIVQLFGENPQFKVTQTICSDGSFESCRTVFEDM